jgi:hypothetical protein
LVEEIGLKILVSRFFFFKLGHHNQHEETFLGAKCGKLILVTLHETMVFFIVLNNFFRTTPIPIRQIRAGNRHATASLWGSHAVSTAELFLLAEVMRKTGDANQDLDRGNKKLGWALIYGVKHVVLAKDLFACQESFAP